MIKKALIYTVLWLIKQKSLWDEKHQKSLDVHFFRKVIKYTNKLTRLFQPIRSDITIVESSLGELSCFYLSFSKKTTQNILYLHGGGYILGLKGSTDKIYQSFCAELAAVSQANVWLVEYDVAPESALKQIIKKTYSAYLALLDKGVKASDTTLMGDSAGGGLALLLLMKLRDDNVVLPKGAILLSPWTDLAVNSDSMITRASKDPILTPFKIAQAATLVRGTCHATDPKISPLYGHFKGLPPLMFILGEHEILYDDAFDAAEKARQAGVLVNFDVQDGLFHVYPLFYGFIKEAKEAILRMASFIKSTA